MSFLKRAIVRASWSFGLGGAHIPLTLVSQAMTQRPSPLPRYDSINEIQEKMSTLRWTEDPWNGKLDLLKHPTFMQEGIELHPEYSGDCEDYAVYWIAVLTLSNLCDECFLGTVLWEVVGNEVKGHACCVYRVKDRWYWVSNWFKGEPRPIKDMYGWIDGMLEYKKVKCLVAGRYKVREVKKDGTVVFGNAVRCR